MVLPRSPDGFDGLFVTKRKKAETERKAGKQGEITGKENTLEINSWLQP